MEYISSNPLVLPVLSLIVAALAVFVGPLISWAVGNQQSKISLLIANKQIIAPMRQVWINNLRDLLSELLGKSHHYYISGFDNRTDEEYGRITELLNRLALYLNPNETLHQDLLKAVDAMVDIIDGGGGDEKSFIKAHKLSMKISRSVLKEEWNRVKEEL